MKVTGSKEGIITAFMIPLFTGIRAIFFYSMDADVPGGLLLIFSIISAAFIALLALPRLYVEFEPDRIVVKGMFTKRTIEIESIRKVNDRVPTSSSGGRPYLEIAASPKGCKIMGSGYGEKYAFIRELVLKLREAETRPKREAILSEYSEKYKGQEGLYRKPLRYYIGMALFWSSIAVLFCAFIPGAPIVFFWAIVPAIAGFLVWVRAGAEVIERLRQKCRSPQQRE